MLRRKAASRLISLLLSFAIPSVAFPATGETRALSHLKQFRWRAVNGSKPPCATLNCLLTWGSAALALGDAGGYARRVKSEGMQQYADHVGITQNFLAVTLLEALPPATPYHFSKRFGLKIKNRLPDGRTEAGNYSIDSRLLVGANVNGIPVNLIFDSGATLTLPGASAAAETLDDLKMPTSSPSGLGKVSLDFLATAKEIVIGDVKINNMMVKKNKGDGSVDSAPGLIGYDLLFRFNAVTFDLRAGTILFNPVSVKAAHCIPMEMTFDRNRLPAGVVVKVLIDDISILARIDTGANVDVLLHGFDVAASKKGNPSDVHVIDSSGSVSPLEAFDARISLDDAIPTHQVLRTPYHNNEVDATLGIKFFAGRIFTFDFRNQKFCLR